MHNPVDKRWIVVRTGRGGTTNGLALPVAVPRDPAGGQPCRV